MKICKIAQIENEGYEALIVFRKLNMERGRLKIDLLQAHLIPEMSKKITDRIAYIDQQMEKIKQKYHFKLPTVDKRQDWEKPTDWSKVKWNESDEEISKQTGKSLLAVKRMRKRLNQFPLAVAMSQQWYKTSRLFTYKELEDLAKSTPYSLLQCVECGRWIDMGKKVISQWKTESEMNRDELKAVSDTKKEIANGRGSGWSTCKYCRASSNNMNWYKTAKKVDHSYSWVFVNIPKDIKKQMIDFGKEIDKDDLYVKEAEDGLEKEPHITVKYGLLTEEAKDPKDCIKGLSGGKVYLGSSSIFECDEYDVVKVTVESKALENIHNELNKLPHEDKHMEYEAHATIAYVKKGCGKKYDRKFKLNKEFSFKEVFFGNNEKDYKISLGSYVFNLSKFGKKNEDKIPLTPEERKQVKSKFGDDLECSFAKDKDGYYCYTHRARSESYSSINEIPQSQVDFIGSTG